MRNPPRLDSRVAPRASWRGACLLLPPSRSLRADGRSWPRRCSSRMLNGLKTPSPLRAKRRMGRRMSRANPRTMAKGKTPHQRETMPLRTIPPARRRRLRAPTPLPRRQAPPRPMARRARPDGSLLRAHRPRARAVLRPMAQKRPLAAAPALPIAGLQPSGLLLTTPLP